MGTACPQEAECHFSAFLLGKLRPNRYIYAQAPLDGAGFPS
jgi:hypothetical protein